MGEVGSGGVCGCSFGEQIRQQDLFIDFYI